MLRTLPALEHSSLPFPADGVAVDPRLQPLSSAFCLRAACTPPSAGSLLADFTPCHIPGCERDLFHDSGEMTRVCLFSSCLHFKGSTGKNNALMTSSSSPSLP